MDLSEDSAKDPAPRILPARRRLSVLAMLASLSVVGTLLTASAPAVADPSESDSLQAKLERLEQKADRLTQDYRGELQRLKDTKRAAKRAASRARHVQRKLKRARDQVGALAAQKYMNGGAAPALSVFMSRDLEAILNRAVTVDYLSQRSVRRLDALRELTTKAPRAKRRAQGRVDKVQREIERLEENRQRVQRLIERYEEQAASRAAPESPPESVPTPDNVTARMARVNAEIVSRFGEGPGVGCYRPDDSGEHPEGRACDYMLSTGGAVPSSAQVQRGYDIAEWAQANAERLGIMYIIYRQRIWDIRCGCGWETMEDRGGVTANHVDHVHISVF